MLHARDKRSSLRNNESINHLQELKSQEELFVNKDSSNSIQLINKHPIFNFKSIFKSIQYTKDEENSSRYNESSNHYHELQGQEFSKYKDDDKSLKIFDNLVQRDNKVNSMRYTRNNETKFRIDNGNKHFQELRDHLAFFKYKDKSNFTKLLSKLFMHYNNVNSKQYTRDKEGFSGDKDKSISLKILYKILMLDDTVNSIKYERDEENRFMNNNRSNHLQELKGKKEFSKNEDKINSMQLLDKLSMSDDNVDSIQYPSHKESKSRNSSRSDPTELNGQDEFFKNEDDNNSIQLLDKLSMSDDNVHSIQYPSHNESKFMNSNKNDPLEPNRLDKYFKNEDDNNSIQLLEKLSMSDDNVHSIQYPSHKESKFMNSNKNDPLEPNRLDKFFKNEDDNNSIQLLEKLSIHNDGINSIQYSKEKENNFRNNDISNYFQELRRLENVSQNKDSSSDSLKLLDKLLTHDDNVTSTLYPSNKENKFRNNNRNSHFQEVKRQKLSKNRDKSYSIHLLDKVLRHEDNINSMHYTKSKSIKFKNKNRSNQPDLKGNENFFKNKDKSNSTKLLDKLLIQADSIQRTRDKETKLRNNNLSNYHQELKGTEEFSRNKDDGNSIQLLNKLSMHDDKVNSIQYTRHKETEFRDINRSNQVEFKRQEEFSENKVKSNSTLLDKLLMPDNNTNSIHSQRDNENKFSNNNQKNHFQQLKWKEEFFKNYDRNNSIKLLSKISMHDDKINSTQYTGDKDTKFRNSNTSNQPELKKQEEFSKNKDKSNYLQLLDKLLMQDDNFNSIQYESDTETKLRDNHKSNHHEEVREQEKLFKNKVNSSSFQLSDTETKLRDKHKSNHHDELRGQENLLKNKVNSSSFQLLDVLLTDQIDIVSDRKTSLTDNRISSSDIKTTCVFDFKGCKKQALKTCFGIISYSLNISCSSASIPLEKNPLKTKSKLKERLLEDEIKSCLKYYDNKCTDYRYMCSNKKSELSNYSNSNNDVIVCELY
ncbi:myb-like protein D [Parasteatoda tepidariorum]|uniref:myb-like protein D n=1 Tax=Parasteatoda tepidariorum TaxID=114398 RepID=UPI001C718425|nr:putative uncharacterized protein DDB_G0282133 [Parasteatoda tepidariorum]